MHQFREPSCPELEDEAPSDPQALGRVRRAMFSPPAPMMRQYCERDDSGAGPVLDEDEGEEVRRPMVECWM